VKAELDQVARTADSLIHRYFPDAELDVTAQEIGREQLERLYERTEAPIAVADELTLLGPGGFETKGEHWRAFTTAVPGTWLREQWTKYESDLMSPNVRATSASFAQSGTSTTGSRPLRRRPRTGSGSTTTASPCWCTTCGRGS
jgi:hypothetical protein